MALARQRLFGNDLQLVERAGGLDLIPNNAGDLAMARGNDNIVQALMLRLKVRKGELAPLGWPDFGSRVHELIGEPNNKRTRIILMAHARNAVERDPRVIEVKEIKTKPIQGERSVVRIQMEIILIEEPNPLNLVFDIDLEGT